MLSIHVYVTSICFHQCIPSPSSCLVLATPNPRSFVNKANISCKIFKGLKKLIDFKCVRALSLNLKRVISFKLIFRSLLAASGVAGLCPHGVREDGGLRSTHSPPTEGAAEGGLQGPDSRPDQGTRHTGGCTFLKRKLCINM